MTTDTVYYLKSILPEDAGLYLIVGFDAFLEINTWKSYTELFDLVPFVVISRPGIGHDDIILRWATLKSFLESKVSDRYQFSFSQRCYVHTDKQTVFTFDVTPIDISSTKVRELVKKGRSIRPLVPDKVRNFIEAKGLYL